MCINFLKGKIDVVAKLLHEAVSEDGEGSLGRIGAAVIVVFTLFWVTFIVFKTGAIPDLSGPSLFLSTGVSATYGTNKLAGAFKKPDATDKSTDSTNN